MIELPTTHSTRHRKVERIDNGFIQRNALGGGERIDRPGSRYRITFTWPVMHPRDARLFELRLERGMAERVRVPMALLGESQGLPGACVVNGTDSGGTTLKLRNVTAGHLFKEGYWLTLTSAGKSHLHKVVEPVQATAGGLAVLTVDPPLRVFPADGDAVEAQRPWIEGFVTGLEPVEHPVNRRIQLTATIEELA